MLGVPHFGGRALEKLELRGRERAVLRFDDAGANNLVHGTDSPESAEQEVLVWFTDVELV